MAHENRALGSAKRRRGCGSGFSAVLQALPKGVGTAAAPSALSDATVSKLVRTLGVGG